MYSSFTMCVLLDHLIFILILNLIIVMEWLSLISLIIYLLVTMCVRQLYPFSFIEFDLWLMLTLGKWCWFYHHFITFIGDDIEVSVFWMLYVHWKRLNMRIEKHLSILYRAVSPLLYRCIWRCATMSYVEWFLILLLVSSS